MNDPRQNPIGKTDPEAWARTWARRIADAQTETEARVGGKLFSRLAYGPDHPDIQVKPQCRDCAVLIGQLHVPGCCVERCPRCGVGQAAYGCDCVAADKAVQ